MRDLLMTFSWQELRHHPWRNAAAVVAVMLGVALAFSVSLINASALSEFCGAMGGNDHAALVTLLGGQLSKEFKSQAVRQAHVGDDGVETFFSQLLTCVCKIGGRFNAIPLAKKC